jgi:tryptophan 2,3-dioxygenase
MNKPVDSNAGRVDLSGEPIHWDLGSSQSYGDYLRLTELLSAQVPVSDAHDETMFIVVHQVSELWIKLFLHELEFVRECVVRDNLDPSFKALQRIAKVQDQLFGVWSVLATMTPSDYTAFRNSLGRSSGFQSLQYRELEFRLGNKNADMIRVHQRNPEEYERLKRALHAPSLYDQVLRLLSLRGYGIPDEILERDFAEAYRASKAVTGAWLGVYHNSEKDWDLYELAEGLVDLDHRFQLWRFQHMKTVERIIGHKMGTGGSSGVGYLSKALELRFFPELWQARTSL